MREDGIVMSSQPDPVFRTSRRIEFADTDMAGIVHFANFFRFMEAPQKKFLRWLGLSVSLRWEGRSIGPVLEPHDDRGAAPDGSFERSHGPQAARARDERARIKAAMQAGRNAPISGIPFEDGVLTSLLLERNRRWEGRSLAEAAHVSGEDPYEFLFELLLAERGRPTMIVFMMSEKDVRRALRWSGTAIGSDQMGVVSDSAHVHPRAYGAFVRVLGHYVRETPLFSLPEAVRRMTGLPADILGLGDRGYVREGLAADLVVFNPSRVTDRSTYEQPTLRPDGIEYVVLNGAVVVEGGRGTGVRMGRSLRAGSGRHHRPPGSW